MSGRGHLLYLGRRPASEYLLARYRYLRAARKGLYEAAPGDTGATAWHLCGTRLGAGHRASLASGGYGGRADAGPLFCAGQASRGAGPLKLLGIQLNRLLRPGDALLGDGRH